MPTSKRIFLWLFLISNLLFAAYYFCFRPKTVSFEVMQHTATIGAKSMRDVYAHIPKQSKISNVTFEETLYKDNGYDMDRIRLVDHSAIPFIFHTSCCKEGDGEMGKLVGLLKRSIQILVDDVESVYYYSHTLDEIDIFMKQYFPSYWDDFNSTLKKIEKIDIFRYLIVYIFGGFWFDSDVELEYNPNYWFNMYAVDTSENMEDIGCIFGVQQSKTSFHYHQNGNKMKCDSSLGYECYYYDFIQWTFACKPGHRVLEIMLETSHPKWDKKINVLAKTGPTLVTEAINIYAEQYGYSTKDIMAKVRESPSFRINDILILSNCAFASNNWNQDGSPDGRWCRQFPTYNLKPLVIHHYHASWRGE